MAIKTLVKTNVVVYVVGPAGWLDKCICISVFCGNTWGKHSKRVVEMKFY